MDREIKNENAINLAAFVCGFLLTSEIKSASITADKSGVVVEIDGVIYSMNPVEVKELQNQISEVAKTIGQ